MDRVLQLYDYWLWNLLSIVAECSLYVYMNSNDYEVEFLSIYWHEMNLLKQDYVFVVVCCGYIIC